MSTETLVPAPVSDPLLTPESNPKRSGRNVTAKVWGARLAVLVVLIALWQFLPDRIVPTVAVSRPGDVARSIGHLVSTGEIFRAFWSTTQQVLYSLVVGAPLGVAIALLTTIPPIRWLLSPIISAAYAIPKVGLISFYILMLGVDTRAHVVFVVSFIVFAFYFGLRDALDDLDRDALSAMRLLGAGPVRVIWLYALPASVANLLTALRIAVPLAFASEVFAELEMPTSTGLGVLLQKAANSLDTATAMAVALIIVLIGYLLDLAIGARMRRYSESMGMGLAL